ncbi:MAG: glycosyltransferase [Planctomycetota bacterium]
MSELAPPALSVIVTTYNKPRDLVRALEGFRGQTFRSFELLVCDDGSGPETREVVQRYAAGVDFPVRHLWQEDTGFRAAASRNNGVRAARGETLVFSDGDCVPLPDFLQRHLDARDAGAFQAGERWLLSQEEADLVTVDAIASGAAFRAPPAREVKRVKRIRRNDAFYWLTGLKPERPRLMTCNCSAPRARVEAINGLDERYEGWGMEDEDLRRRLVMQGARPRSVIGVANCLHLWHPADDTFLGKRKQSPNWRYYARGFQLSRCRRGLRERPLAEVSARYRGPRALVERARAALGLREAGPDERPEVEVVLGEGGEPLRAGGDAEVRVGLAGARPERVAGIDLLCAPDLPLGGGELPREEHPEVSPALKKAGVSATRPLPAPGAPGGLEAARELLEVLL